MVVIEKPIKLHDIGMVEVHLNFDFSDERYLYVLFFDHLL